MDSNSLQFDEVVRKGGINMRNWFNIGDGWPMTSVVVLACGPVLFGLALLFFEPIRDPSVFYDLFRNPGSHPIFIVWTLTFMHLGLSPTEPSSDNKGDEEARPWSTLRKVSDSFQMTALGMIVSLMIIVQDGSIASIRQNGCVYVALVLTIISIAMRWTDPRAQLVWKPQRQSAN